MHKLCSRIEFPFDFHSHSHISVVNLCFWKYQTDRALIYVVYIMCPKLTVGKRLVFGCNLVNTYGELCFRSIQLLSVVLFRNNSVGK